MSIKQKTAPVRDLKEMRYLLATKMAEFENGTLSSGDAKVYIGFASAIVNTFKVEIANNAVAGMNTKIDLLIENKPNPLLDAPKN